MTKLVLLFVPKSQSGNCSNLPITNHMRVAINARFLLKNHLEGIGRYTFEVTQRMAKAHPNDVFLLFFDRNYSEEFVFGENVVPIVLFPQARHPLLFVWWFEWSVARALKEYKADVFWSPDNFLSLRARVPTLLTVHDVSFAHFPEQVGWLVKQYYRYFTPRFLEKATYIHAVSEFTRQDIIRNFHLPAQKISVAYNGVRPIFAPISPSTKTILQQKYANGMPYFFYVGAIHPRKNVHRLILSFNLFKQNNPTAQHQLLLAGRWAWQTGEVRTAYEGSLFKDDIIFLNYIQDADLQQLMAAATALLYVSEFEGFGVPIIEAMASGVPVVTSDTSSMPEVAGGAALLVSPKDTAAIANALEIIAFQPDIRQKYIELGLLRAQYFNWDATADIVYEALSDTIA
jgi:glycosyltransferase involved in cell wall biosynthesis